MHHRHGIFVTEFYTLVITQRHVLILAHCECRTICPIETTVVDRSRQKVCYPSLPLISRLRSGWCHGGGGVLRGERELLLSMLEHLPAENSVSEAIDLVLFLVAETARGLHKNGNGEIGSALFLHLT